MGVAFEGVTFVGVAIARFARYDHAHKGHAHEATPTKDLELLGTPEDQFSIDGCKKFTEICLNPCGRGFKCGRGNVRGIDITILSPPRVHIHI